MILQIDIKEKQKMQYFIEDPRNKIIQKSLPCTKEDLRKSIDARVISRQSCDSRQTNDDFQDILIQTDHKILSMEIIRTFRN